MVVSLCVPYCSLILHWEHTHEHQINAGRYPFICPQCCHVTFSCLSFSGSCQEDCSALFCTYDWVFRALFEAGRIMHGDITHRERIICDYMMSERKLITGAMMQCDIWKLLWHWKGTICKWKMHRGQNLRTILYLQLCLFLSIFCCGGRWIVPPLCK